jgi:kinesin family member 15
MVRDLGAHRRTPSEAGNDENAPAGNDAPAAVSAGAGPDAASRPPLLAIQLSSGVKRKTDSPAPTPSKLPFRTPEKAAARARFGWAAHDLPPRAGACATPYAAMTTPRAHRGKAASEGGGGGSTQSTPTKSVTKPGVSGSRPPLVSGGPRGAGFSTAGRGALLSLGSAPASSAEVPHFVLREDPSFWMENNVQVNCVACCSAVTFASFVALGFRNCYENKTWFFNASFHYDLIYYYCKWYSVIGFFLNAPHQFTWLTLSFRKHFPGCHPCPPSK